MPVSPFPVYKEESLILGLEPYKLPILLGGTVIIVEPSFYNGFLKYFAGWLIPSVEITGLNQVNSSWKRTYLNSKQFISFSIPYFPSTYELSFKASEFCRGRPFTLTIWEVT